MNVDTKTTSELSELDAASNACLELCARHGFATGHGDTVADIIREIDGQITERLAAKPYDGRGTEAADHALPANEWPRYTALICAPSDDAVRCPDCAANWELFKPPALAPLPFTSRRFIRCMACDAPFFDRECTR